MFIPLGHAAEVVNHPEQLGAFGALAFSLYYMAKLAWTARKDKKATRRLESKLENDKDSSLNGIGSPNPGRTTVDLLEVLHDDLRDFKKEATEIHTKQAESLGYLRGKLDK